MTIIPQNNENNQECANRILAFFKTFEIEKLLHRCNVAKQKGFTVIEIPESVKLKNIKTQNDDYKPKIKQKIHI